MKKKNLSIFLIFVLMTACRSTSAISDEAQLATIVAGTLTAQPVVDTPVFTAVALPTATETPVVKPNESYYIFTRAQNVNLRVQPGTLFSVSRVMPQGTRLQVLGIAPGGEWAYVRNDEGINGWVGLAFVDEFPLEQFPFVEPGDVQIIRGRVVDSNGLPVNGIGFAVDQNSLRADSTTDALGVFYVYLPKNYSGTWRVSYVSISSTSTAITAECLADSSACGKTEPLSVFVTLPVTTDLNFVWKP